MSIFLDPTGQPTYGIGLCARCSRKFLLADLYDDPNEPGLKVCIDDLDEFDPYRLPARTPEDINLPFCRPDVPLDGVNPNPNIFVFVIGTNVAGVALGTVNGRALEDSGAVP
jgi:hypothetical protein